MPSSSDVLPLWCGQCDQRGTPSKFVRLIHTRTGSGAMMVRCMRCGQTLPYESLMASNPRMDRPALVEKQPQGTMQIPVWIYPEALEALRRAFPDNLQTTLCATMTALADRDTVLVEGEHARAMRELGVKTGREVLGLARQVKTLTAELEQARIREKALEPFVKLLAGMVHGGSSGPGGQAGQQQQGQPQSLQQSATPLTPNAQGLLVPADEWAQTETWDGGDVDPWAGMAAGQQQPTSATPALDEPSYRGIPVPVRGVR